MLWSIQNESCEAELTRRDAAGFIRRVGAVHFESTTSIEEFDFADWPLRSAGLTPMGFVGASGWARP